MNCRFSLFVAVGALLQRQAPSATSSKASAILAEDLCYTARLAWSAIKSPLVPLSRQGGQSILHDQRQELQMADVILHAPDTKRLITTQCIKIPNMHIVNTGIHPIGMDCGNRTYG